MIRRMALGLLLLVALLAPMGAAGSAAGTTFVVTKVEDTADGTCDTDCSLREAIVAANDSPGGDTVIVQGGLYLLGLGPLDITDSLVLNGAGAADTVIDGQALDSVIGTSSFAADISISGVTIQNGKDGAVVNFANLTISDSIIKDSHSEFSMGGGIVNLWALVLNRSTVTGNSAPSGAALYLDSYGNAFIINSTISGNVATITGNQVEPPGGAILADGGLTILNSTIASNTGLAFSANTNYPRLMFNSIVAGNTPANCGYTPPLGDHNLDSDGSCGFSGPGDLSNVNPLIGPLADNGGAAPTHALLPSSPAIDGGESTLCVIADQRGVERAGASCDLGAYEATAAQLAAELAKGATAIIAGGSTFVVTKTTDSADGVCDVADCSLREAIIAANNTPGPDSVTVPAGTYYLTIPPEPPPSPSNGDLDITDGLTIVGAGARSTIIDGGGLDGILSIPDATSHVRVSGLTMRAAAGGYGTIFNDGFLAIDQAVIEDNLEPISFSGGGITNDAALIINRSTIKGSSGYYGGGVMVTGSGNALIVNSTVSANSGEEGAGIDNDGSVVTMNSTIAFNEGTGLASILPSGEAIMLNTIVANSTGDDCGGDVDGNHNLDTDGTCGLTAEGDRSFAQAMLRPLADNGGPTPTHALSPGGCTGDACVLPSEAINTGSNAYCLMVDQRGAPRPLLGTCDMGAYEYGDADADGIPDTTDNCPTVANADGQTADTDGDLAGDACDGPGTGNVDCSGPTNGVTAVDALKVLRYVAGLSVSQSEPCLDIGQPRLTPATEIMGDVDCDTDVDAVDALKILRTTAGLFVALPAQCPPIIGPP